MKGGFPLFTTQWLFITQNLIDLHVYYSCHTDDDDKKQLVAQEYLDLYQFSLLTTTDI